MTLRAIRRLSPALLALVLLLPLGCVNPFKPSDPEAPSGDGVVESFKTTEEVLETLRLAIENKTVNGENAYAHCFADSVAPSDIAFRAFYDPAVVAVWSTDAPIPAPEPWNLALENKVPRYLFGVRQNATYSWQWSRDPFSGNDEESGTTALLHRKYVLLATDPSSSNTGEVIAVGYCDLNMVFNGTRWSIVRWTDRVDPTVGANPSTDQRTMTWWRLKSLTR